MNKDHHEQQRAENARLGYINWRMRDLPSVYQNLLPYSFDVAELWKAEKAIRRQYVCDLKLAASPWRLLGAQCLLLNYDNLSALDKLTFGMEVSIPHGMEDQPRRPLCKIIEYNDREAAIEQLPKFERPSKDDAESNDDAE